MAGKIVLSSEVYFKSDPDLQRIGTEQVDRLKAQMDELHLRKIDISDEVLVINPGGYMGVSTRSEVAYARSKGKPVRFLVEILEPQP